MSQPETARDLLDSKKALTDTLDVCIDTTYADALILAETASIAANEAAAADPNNPAKAAAKVDAANAYEAAKDAYELHAKRTLTLRALSRKDLKKLQEDPQHRPTEAQKAAYKERVRRLSLPEHMTLEYNTDTFPPALIAATVESPPFTLEEATELWNGDNWSDGELQALYSKCQVVNKMLK